MAREIPPAMIKALLAEEADYTKWTAMAEKFFSRYEGLTITINGHNGVEKGLTPAALWWDIDLVAEPAPEGLLMENGDPINGEDSTSRLLRSNHDSNRPEIYSGLDS